MRVKASASFGNKEPSSQQPSRRQSHLHSLVGCQDLGTAGWFRRAIGRCHRRCGGRSPRALSAQHGNAGLLGCRSGHSQRAARAGQPYLCCLAPRCIAGHRNAVVFCVRCLCGFAKTRDPACDYRLCAQCDGYVADADVALRCVFLMRDAVAMHGRARHLQWHAACGALVGLRPPHQPSSCCIPVLYKARAGTPGIPSARATVVSDRVSTRGCRLACSRGAHSRRRSCRSSLRWRSGGSRRSARSRMKCSAPCCRRRAAASSTRRRTACCRLSGTRYAQAQPPAHVWIATLHSLAAHAMSAGSPSVRIVVDPNVMCSSVRSLAMITGATVQTTSTD